MTEHPFRTLGAETVFRNPWIKLERHELESVEDGHRFTYAYISSAPSVMVAALTPSNEIVVIRQYLYPSRRYSYELPGGGSAGKPLEQAAADELEEETGWRAGALERLGDFIVYCGLSDETCAVFLARDLRRGKPNLEKTERISVHETPYPRLRRMIERGEFRDGMGLASLGIARSRLEQLTGAAGV